MEALDLYMDFDEAWPELREEALAGANVYQSPDIRVTAMARVPRGTMGGKSSVMVRIDLPDGSFLLAGTTLALLATAVRAFKGADERDGIPTVE